MAEEVNSKQCPITKKRLSRAKRYYRDGVFYYNKASWKKAAAAKQAQAAESSEE